MTPTLLSEAHRPPPALGLNLHHSARDQEVVSAVRVGSIRVKATHAALTGRTALYVGRMQIDAITVENICGTTTFTCSGVQDQ